MSGNKIISIANRWFTTSVGVTALILLLSFAMGFVFMPYAEPKSRMVGIWDSICSAAGFPVRNSVIDFVAPDFHVSSVALGTDDLHDVPPGAIGRGATLAQQCAICHGPAGVSRADSPNLAGQHADVIYKQLHDFKTGARVNAIMTPFALRMSDGDMRDLAAYYAFLPRLPGTTTESLVVPAIVEVGAPMRGIAPCGACHGGIESKRGSPWLYGQSAAYVESQLRAFVSGGRHNDTSEQMRNIARAMTDEEINTAARYYASLQQ